MDFRTQEESFQDTDRRYAELERRREDGSISDGEFDSQRQQLMVRDDEGRWWAKLGESGEWHRRDGGDWVRDTPPRYQEAESGDPGHPPAKGAEGGAEGGAEDGVARRRKMPLWIPVVGLGGVALIAIVLVFWVLAPYLRGEPAGDGYGAEEQGGQATGGVALDEVFVHRATPENITANSTYIDNSLTNGNPDAILIVTQSWNPQGDNGIYNDHSVGVWYDSGRERWAVFNQDREAMTEGAAFNVAVLAQPE